MQYLHLWPHSVKRFDQFPFPARKKPFCFLLALLLFIFFLCVSANFSSMCESGLAVCRVCWFAEKIAQLMAIKADCKTANCKLELGPKSRRVQNAEMRSQIAFVARWVLVPFTVYNFVGSVCLVFFLANLLYWASLSLSLSS